MTNHNGILGGKEWWHWYPPKHCFWYDYVNNLNANSAVNGGLVTLIDFTLPVASAGVVRWFGQDLSSVNGWQLVTWKIIVNGGPDNVYGSIVGQIASMADPTDVYIPLTRGARVQLQAVNSDAVNITCFGRLKGWWWVDND